MADNIITRQCSCCKKIKPPTEFFKDRKEKSGLCYYCKTCSSFHTKQYYQTKKGKVSHQLSNKQYRQTRKGKRIHYLSYIKYKKRYPQKRKAHKAVYNAIYCGKIQCASSFKCAFCQKQAKQYHHPDYAKPFLIVPVCRKCHKLIHPYVSPVVCPAARFC